MKEYIVAFRNYSRDDSCVNFMTELSSTNSNELRKVLAKYAKTPEVYLFNSKSYQAVNQINSANKINWIDRQINSNQNTRGQKFCLLFQSLQNAIEFDDYELMEYIVNKRDELGIGTEFPEEEFYPFDMARQKIKDNYLKLK